MSTISIEKGKKRKNIHKLTYIAAGIIFMVIAIIMVKRLFSGIGNGDAYVYLSDGKYKLMTKLEQEDAVEISTDNQEDKVKELEELLNSFGMDLDDLDSDMYGFDAGVSGMEMSDVVKFSPDKKYIYYFCDYDSSYETATLCRAEYGKLKTNTPKNSNYIETIATNVLPEFEFLANDAIAYINSAGTLFYYDGKESVMIATDVMRYYGNGADKIVFTKMVSNEGCMAYGVKTNDISNTIQLAYDCTVVQPISDFENILYLKFDENELGLYEVGFEKEAKLLAANIDDYIPMGEKIYFTAKNGMKLRFEDYVEDTLAEADAKVTEPEPYDFASATPYTYEMINDYDAKEDDYYELYTSCTNGLFLYGENFWPYSMKEAAHMNWGSNSEGFCGATQKFIDKFADMANEDGFILVTDGPVSRFSTK